MATVLSPTAEGLHKAGEWLREGRLVAFPTETVYGLGANALDESAVLKIFEFKGRPLTDPLIVHVPDVETALGLAVIPSEKHVEAFKLLAKHFWPGPLTMVVRAAECIPLKVTADSGWVGLRCPKLPLALEMLKVAKVPVAAPSANRFGHVSPTSAAHVLADLGSHPIGVIDGGDSVDICDIGIESTVLKLDFEASKVLVYRRGGVALDHVAAALREGGFELDIEVVAKAAKHGSGEDKGLVAPGQLLTHYAPDVETFLVAADSDDVGAGKAEEDEPKAERRLFDGEAIKACVVLDFNKRLLHLKDRALAYRDLSATGDILEARAQVFASLRWAELVEGAKSVLVCDLRGVPGEHVAALTDRLFRSASGKEATVSMA